MRNLQLALVINRDFDRTLERIVTELSGFGLQTLRTFDFQDARHPNPDYTCPYHGEGPCDCQMVVLLVYQGSRRPVSLVLHGHDMQTWLYLVDTPQQHADPYLRAAIQQVIDTEAEIGCCDTRRLFAQ